MTIMAADSHSDRLADLVEQLNTVFLDETIVEFINPMMAVKYSFDNPVDIVFTDIPMRGIDGITLSEGVHQKNPDAKVFFLADTDEYKAAAMKRGCAGYLIRPVTIGIMGEIAIEVKKWNGGGGTLHLFTFVKDSVK